MSSTTAGRSDTWSELVRRVDGRPLGTFFREEVAGPLGLYFMLSIGPEHDSRCAEIVGDDDLVNTRDWRAAGDGAATGHGTAESIARLYAALGCGVGRRSRGAPEA